MPLGRARTGLQDDAHLDYRIVDFFRRAFVVKLRFLSYFSTKRRWFVMYWPRIGDPHSILFDSRYSMPMFGEVSKITFYKAKLSNYGHLNLRIWPTVARKLKLRPRPGSFLPHKSSSGLRTSKRAFVKKCVFRCKPRYTVLREILVCTLLGTLFWKPNIPLDSFWRIESNFKLKSLFWLMDKISLFRQFCN